MTALPHHARPTSTPPPPLRNGDRLPREEFERRYLAMPGVNKAELVEGTVVMPSPVSVAHGFPHWLLGTWSGVYYARTPGLAVGGDNLTVRLDSTNVVQPDLILMLPRHLGGRARLDDDGYISGPPDLAIEVAFSSASIDLHAKLEAYRRNGVREYLVWRVEDGAIDWSGLAEGAYRPLTPTDGILRSAIFPGLWLDVPALLKQDMPAVLATLEKGLATPEHAAFVQRLRTA